jgi:hypothetical protein
MAQGRRRQIDVSLDVTGGRAVVSRLHDETNDGEADGVPQRAQLLGVSV